MEFLLGLIIGVILMCCLVVSGNFDYKVKWDELRKWLLAMKNEKCLDKECLDEVLSKMNWLESDEDEQKC